MKPLVIFIIFFSATFAYGQQVNASKENNVPTSKIITLHTDALRYIENGNYEEARKALKYILALTPNDPNINFDLAKVYMAQENYVEAILHFKEADRLGLGLGALNKCFFYVAECYLRLKNEAEAIIYFEKCIELNPHNYDAKNLLDMLRASRREDGTLKIEGEPDPEEKYPVRWTEYLDIKEPAEIQGLLDKPLEIAKDCQNCKLVLMSDAKDLVTINNCKEYWQAKDNDFYAADSYNISLETWFKLRCNANYYHKIPIPSKISFLADLDLTKHPIKNLPLALRVLHYPEEKEKIAKATLEFRDWNEYIGQKIKVEAENKDNITFILNENEKMNIRLLMWGDFNYDGFEDALLEVTLYKQDAQPQSECVVITKMDRDGRMLRLEE